MKNIGIIILMVILTSCGSSLPESESTGEINNPSNDQQINKGVTVEVIKLIPVKFQHFIQINGSIKAENEAIVSTEIMGQVQNIYVTEGQTVKKGQLLVSLNASVTESSIREVQTSLELATKTYEKQEELWKENIGTELQYLQAKNNKETLESRLETLQARLEMAKPRAPFNGMVDEIYMKIGELASPGGRVLHIVNLNNMKVFGDVSESYLLDIHAGDQTELSFPVYPDYTRKAKIHRTGEVINEKSRTFRIEIKLSNEEKKLKPNLITKIRLNDFTDESALVVPSYVIKQDFTGWFLYVAKKNGDNYVAKKIYIKPGRSFNNQTMILDGLNENDKVIVVGYNLVSGGAYITPA
jgi:RND family efflux transporter MFP subunit